MSQLKYWIWLSMKDRLRASLKSAAYRQFDTLEELYYADKRELRQIDGIEDRDIAELMNKDMDSVERVLEQCERGGIQILTMQDAIYPSRLKNIPDPPLVLYYKGRMPAFDEEVAIAVIGTRTPTPYGLSVAETISYDIAKGGGYIVSGMARGLDSQAAIGALKAGKPTAAILGGGVDVIYPPENERLWGDIVAAGVVISEYVPGAEPMGRHFPERNRIISGLSCGVLVVEAGERSGTAITAAHASEQGRDLFAIPGAINAPMSVGTNALIRDGFAKLTVCAADVLEEYAHSFASKIVSPSRRRAVSDEAEPETREIKPATPVERKIDPKKLAELPENRQKILALLNSGPMYLDDIVDGSGMDAATVLGEVTMLVLDGFLKELAGKRYAPGEKLLV